MKYNTQKQVKEIAYVIEPLENISELEPKLNEINQLIFSAGGEVHSSGFQIVREITPSTYIGKGKLEEIAVEIADTDVNLVVFDGELTPSQTLNISAKLNDIKVIDRTTLILDIFAANAKSTEGKLQIELAQLKYIYPRLKGKGSALSRLGGGIGTRGPGETQLETDRRHIRSRIFKLEEQLDNLEKRRKIQSDRRKKNENLTVALVGYTNTGKSTLLNALTGSDVLAENKLFATLDPTVRKLSLNVGDVLLVDTVGFVKNIPHHIIEAFKSTLELAVNADLILNICDASADYKEQLNTTNKTLEELKCKSKIITVVNKCDAISDFSGFPQDAVFISAKTGFNLDLLRQTIEKAFADTYISLELSIPYSKLNDFNKLNGLITSLKLEYLEEAVIARLIIKKIYLNRIESLDL